MNLMDTQAEAAGVAGGVAQDGTARPAAKADTVKLASGGMLTAFETGSAKITIGTCSLHMNAHANGKFSVFGSCNPTDADHFIANIREAAEVLGRKTGSEPSVIQLTLNETQAKNILKAAEKTQGTSVIGLFTGPTKETVSALFVAAKKETSLVEEGPAVSRFTDEKSKRCIAACGVKERLGTTVHKNVFNV